MDLALVETIERMRLATYPPLEITAKFGMTVGASHGESGRANSALALGPPTAAAAEAIEWASLWLSERALAPLFRITPLTPPDVVSTLAESESFDSPTNQTDTMHHRLSDEPIQTRTKGSQDTTVIVQSNKPSDWLTERNAEGAAEVEALMENVDGDVCWTTVGDGTRTIAVGRGVVSNRWLSIQAMLTEPESRGLGLATTILGQLHTWGRDRGATDSFLDVMSANTGAKSLYQRVGYEPIYQYHYVGSPQAPSSC